MIVLKIEQNNYVPDAYECQIYYKVSLLVGYNKFSYQVMRRIYCDLTMFTDQFLEDFACERPDVIQHLVHRIEKDSMYNYRYYPRCVIKEVMPNNFGETIINNIRQCNDLNLFISLWRLYEQTHFIRYVEKTFKKKWTQYYFPRVESIVKWLAPEILQINTYDYIEHWTRSPDGSYISGDTVEPSLWSAIQKYKSVTINTIPTRMIIVDTNQVVW